MRLLRHAKIFSSVTYHVERIARIFKFLSPDTAVNLLYLYKYKRKKNERSFVNRLGDPCYVTTFHTLETVDRRAA